MWGMSNLYFVVKIGNAEYLLKGVSIEHFYLLKIKYNLTFGFNFVSKLYLGIALSNFVFGAPRFPLTS